MAEDTVRVLSAEAEFPCWMLVDTDNFGGDYPDEKFLKADSIGEDLRQRETTYNPLEAHVWANKAVAQAVADKWNKYWGDMSPRYWKVVQVGYKLQPGFEP